MEELQMDEATRARWIFYSALDAKATWELYHSLQVGSSCAIIMSLLGPAIYGCSSEVEHKTPNTAGCLMCGNWRGLIIAMQLHLQAKLQEMPCVEQSIPATQIPGTDQQYSMWHMYQRYWQPFGELLTDMEREGMLVDR